MLRLALLAVALTLAYANMDERWALFKHRHGKTYTDEEDETRRAIFSDNWDYIQQHNAKYDAGEVTYWLGINRFADMTTEEFSAVYKGFHKVKTLPKTVEHVSTDDLPDTVDWRDAGVVTDIKDQGQCGSCWTFSTTGSIEGQHALATGELVSLSEEQIVDCFTSKPKRDEGCDGGFQTDAMQYVIDNGGIDTEDSYPYTASNGREGTCAFKSSTIGATISSYKTVTEGSESALQDAVANIGPISVSIDANHNSFQLYAGGVYDEPQCSSTALDHAVLAIGYGTDDGTDYWLVKNSWGLDWGIDGYIMMSRNKDNQCGIASDGSYPVV